jgi:hypothetical protein
MPRLLQKGRVLGANLSEGEFSIENMRLIGKERQGQFLVLRRRESKGRILRKMIHVPH